MQPEALRQDLPPINGILEEGEDDMKDADKDADDPEVLDASMIADAQVVEHYEIARYGTLVAWANQLGMKEAATLLNETLEQEYDADRTLTELAEFEAQPVSGLRLYPAFNIRDLLIGAGLHPPRRFSLSP